MTKINLNDGIKPRPRELIEDCFIANEWNDQIAIKYFLKFLRGATNNWYRSMIKPKIETIQRWQQLKTCFIKHHLGQNEERRINKEWGELVQKPRELSNEFIPTASRLAEIIYSQITEDEAIQAKLRPELATGLALQTISD